MALITKNPTSNTNPDDSGQGGIAVTGAINTGHGSTTSSQTGAGSQTKTCKWSALAAGPSVPLVSTVLKFDWAEDGTVVNGGANGFRVQYSLNGGGAWSTAFDHVNVASPATGSTSVPLSNSQDLTQVQIRDRLQATGADVGDSASVTASISNIRVEIQTQDVKVIVMM